MDGVAQGRPSVGVAGTEERPKAESGQVRMGWGQMGGTHGGGGHVGRPMGWGLHGGDPMGVGVRKVIL